MSRRHRLHSEASYRFERGVDRELPPRATARAAALLASLGGATVVPGLTTAEVPVTPVTIELAADYPDRVAGVVYGLDTVVARLQEVGCDVRSTPASHEPTVAPWRAQAPRRRRPPRQARPSAHGPAGHPAVLASRPDRPGRPGRGGHPPRGLRQRPGPPAPRHRRPRPHQRGSRRCAPIARTLADAGFVEVHSEPFGPASEADQPDAAGRRPAPARGRGRQPAQRRPAAAAHHPAARPLPRPRRGTSAAASATSPCSRPAWSSCPGRARRASRRSSPPTGGRPRRSSRRSTRRCPTSRCGSPGCWPAYRELPGWWGPGTGRDLGRRDRGGPLGRPPWSHLTLDVRAAAEPPLAPGPVRGAVRARGTDSTAPRLASNRVAGRLRGRAAPAGGRGVRPARADLRVRARLRRARGRRRGGRARSAAPRCRPTRSPPRTSRSWWPADVPAADVAAALTAGAGELLEDVRLFDVYTGAQLGAGPQVAGVHAAAARARPHADRRRGDGRPRRRRGRGRPAHRRGAAGLARSQAGGSSHRGADRTTGVAPLVRRARFGGADR